MTRLNVRVVGWCSGTLGMLLVSTMVIISVTFILLDGLEVLFGHLVSIHVMIGDVRGS